ncbi:hypothetical protein FRB95_002314 [Tulasnella sp. JGI-2019a]|nr:hypothetical protein FRB95_002314 [Tulasnella sp. JGI-2019a]
MMKPLLILIGTVLAVFAGLAQARHNVTVDNNTTKGAVLLTTCPQSYYTFAKGSYMTFTFTGVALEIVGTYSPNGGVLDIKLDNVPTELDVYGPSIICNMQLFEAPQLANGTHTLTMTLATDSPEALGGYPYIEINRATYTVLDPGDVVGPISSSSISSATSSSASTLSSTSSVAANSTSAVSASAKSGVSGAMLGVIIAAVLIFIALLVLLFYFLRRRWALKDYSIDHYDAKTDLDGAAMMEPLILEGRHPNRKDSRGSPIEIDIQLQNADPWSPERAYQSPSYTMTVKSPVGATDGSASGVSPLSDVSGYDSGVYKAPLEPSPSSSPPIIVRQPSNSTRARPESWLSSRSSNSHYPQSAAVPSTIGDHTSNTSSQRPQSIADTDVDRIAARVASMINQRQPWDGQQPPPPEVDWTGGGEFIPPPAYAHGRKPPAPPG